MTFIHFKRCGFKLIFILSTFINYLLQKTQNLVISLLLPSVIDISIDKIIKHLCCCSSVSFFLNPGGHENFAKMIDEAEVLEFPMVVKNTRGHRGVYESLLWHIIVKYY